MAKRARTVKSGGTSVIMVPTAAPVTRRRRASSPRRRKTKRRSSGGSRGGGALSSRMLGAGAGGFAVGFLEKTFPGLPTLPIVGKKGAIAIAAYFLHGKHPIITDVGMAAAAISGYELGSTGKITGDDGLAAQM